MKALIFDLDLTLVDTKVLETYRDRRDWGSAYANIPRCSLYSGMSEVFDYIRSHGYKVCIVSSSPRTYVERVASYFSIPANYIVGYHDAHPIKPHPAPMIKALELMGEAASNAISFGDRGVDITASNAAGIESVACFWGTRESQKLAEASPSIKLDTTGQLMSVIMNGN